MKQALLAIVMMCGVAGYAQKPKEDVYIDKQLAIINAHYDALVRLGKADAEQKYLAPNMLGEYSWHGGLCKMEGTRYTSCLFGSYTFSEARYQAMMSGKTPDLSGVIGRYVSASAVYSPHARVAVVALTNGSAAIAAVCPEGYDVRGSSIDDLKKLRTAPDLQARLEEMRKLPCRRKDSK